MTGRDMTGGDVTGERARTAGSRAQAPKGLIVICGLRAEAKIAAGPGITVIAGGGDSSTLEAALQAACATASAFISFGIAGGLAPTLRPGACLVARDIVMPGAGLYPAHPQWAAQLATATGGTLARLAGVDSPLADVAGKQALHRDTGAAAVDMESHIVARVAAAHGLPFAAIRIVADAADHPLPHAATVGMRPDGRVAVGAVLASLVRDPSQIPGLIRTARDANVAFASLFRCRQLLGGQFGFVDFGDPLLDMA